MKELTRSALFDRFLALGRIVAVQADRRWLRRPKCDCCHKPVLTECLTVDDSPACDTHCATELAVWSICGDPECPTR